MFKYPDRDVREKDEKSLLQELINSDNIKVGDRVAICCHPCTCVHINNNDYFFSFDEVFARTFWDDAMNVLMQIYNTGMYNGDVIFDSSTLRDIDYLFLPDIYQLFGSENNSKDKDKHREQFTWYGMYDNLARVKGNHLYKRLTPYWTCNYDSTEQAYIVTCLGEDDYEAKTDETIGVPVFFKMHKEV
jgi:hypothetical protein